jgi:hypothetical protein
MIEVYKQHCPGEEFIYIYEEKDKPVFFTGFVEPYPSDKELRDGIFLMDYLEYHTLFLFNDKKETNSYLNFGVKISPHDESLSTATHIFTHDIFKFPYFTAKFYFYQIRSLLIRNYKSSIQTTFLDTIPLPLRDLSGIKPEKYPNSLF